MSHPPTDLLAGLTPDRAEHSRQVARTVAMLAPQWCPIDHVGDLVTAALLHDVGYHPDLAHTGFHPLDGAIYLAEHGYSPLTCHLVATHTAAHLEAEVRGIPAKAFAPFLLPFPTDLERAVLAYADLTTLHTGQPCTVQQRLTSILERYHQGPVRQYVTTHYDALLAAGSAPDGLRHRDAEAILELPQP